ncbi:GntR family transcriptional regulator [Prauserella sediminis]|uniref:GntR family transcriptional regulator n=1 Tax=Prauserella sediminis TaxID=577680 RepID=A0A839XKT6_9PSEU|nr:GntR family transcriptional regulator [Prauserella sediminis]MBB3662449.1 GntR family transcriptional regulator [Prauserella sediminis]
MASTSKGVPQYMQIAGTIREQIRAGTLQPGEQVPSAPSLCEQYDVSMITAKNALNLLKSEGVVYAVPGKATYVADNTRLIRTAPQRYFQRRERTYVQETERAGLRPTSEHSTETVTATRWIAQRLEIQEGDAVTATTYRISAGEHPVAVSTSWEPQAVTAGTPIAHPHEGPHGNDGLNARFAAIGWTVEQVEEHLLVRQPSPEERDDLRLAPEVPVVEIRQTVRATQDGDDLTAIEAADIVYASDRYEFRYIMDRPR